MKTFDQNLLRQVGVGQNYLWEKYPGEIAPLGATVVDGMQAFMPAHTAAVGLTGCAPCEAGQVGVSGPALTPITKIAAPYHGPGSSSPTPTPVGPAVPVFTPPATIPNLPVTPVAPPAPATTNTALMIAGVAAVAVGLGGILWLAHSQGS